MVKRYALLLLLLAFAVPASARKHKAPKASPKRIDSLMVFDPLSVVSVIRNNDAAEYNDSASAVARRELLKAMQHYASRMKLKAFWSTDDTMLAARVNNEIFYVLANARGKHYLEDIQQPTAIDSIIGAMNYRFALIVLNSGFIRTRENFKQERRKDNLAALKTLGFYEEIPLRLGSVMRAMIIDAKEHKTYYYKDDHSTEDLHPLEYGSLKIQFHDIFEGFFWHDSDSLF